MRKSLQGYDIAAGAYLGLVTVLVLIFRPPGTLVYLLGHAAAPSARAAFT